MDNEFATIFTVILLSKITQRMNNNKRTAKKQWKGQLREVFDAFPKKIMRHIAF